MRFGAHVFVWQDQFTDDDLLRILENAKEWGLSFLEIPIGDDIIFSPQLISKQAQDCNLELVLSPGGNWPMNCDISLESQSDRIKGINWHKKAIELSAESNAIAYTGAIYGHPGAVLRRGPCQDELERTAEGLNELATFSKSHNVKLVLEPMSHFRTHIANKPEQVNQLIQKAGHPNLFSLMDTYHLATEIQCYEKAFEEFEPLLWGIHACETNRGAPGTGFLPWDKLMKAVVKNEWDGYWGLESYNSTWRDGQFAYERGMFHHVCDNAEEFIKQSVSFLSDLHERCTNG
jgi:D-psicose/D-tagatose/L-ribulose 3-epimerase